MTLVKTGTGCWPNRNENNSKVLSIGSKLVIKCVGFEIVILFLEDRLEKGIEILL